MSKSIFYSLLFGAAAFLMPLNNYAQDTTASGKPDYKVSIGPKFGPSTTEFKGADVPSNFYSRDGLKAGAFVKYDVQRWFAFQVEFMYHQQGIDTDFDANQGRESYWGLHYFQLPILAKFQYPLNDMFYPHVYAGPTVEFLVTNQADGRVYGQTYNEDKIQSPQPTSIPDAKFIDDVSNWDVAATFGGGLDMEFGRFFLGAEYRYDLGLRQIPVDQDGNDMDMKNRASSWLFSLGINF